MQRLELLSEKRPLKQGQEDQIEEEASRCCKLLRSKRCQRAKLVGLRHVAQEPGYGSHPVLAHHSVDTARQIRKPARLGDSESHQTDGIADQRPAEDGDAYAYKPFLDGCSGRYMVLKPSDVGINVAHHNGRKELLLAREPGIDGWLPRARQASDLFDTGTGQPAFEKYTTRRIKDPRLHLSGALARWTAGADGTAFVRALLSHCNPSHEQRPSRSRDLSIMSQAKRLI